MPSANLAGAELAEVLERRRRAIEEPERDGEGRGDRHRERRPAAESMPDVSVVDPTCSSEKPAKCEEIVAVAAAHIDDPGAGSTEHWRHAEAAEFLRRWRAAEEDDSENDSGDDEGDDVYDEGGRFPSLEECFAAIPDPPGAVWFDMAGRGADQEQMTSEHDGRLEVAGCSQGSCEAEARTTRCVAEKAVEAEKAEGEHTAPETLETHADGRESLDVDPYAASSAEAPREEVQLAEMVREAPEEAAAEQS